METFHPSMVLPFSYTFASNAITSSGGISSVCTNNNSDTSPWMDPRIWSKLPQRLVDRVIAFLPPPAFFRARAVCKRWYALLYSDSFLQLSLQVSPSRSCFIFFNHKISPTSYICKNSDNNTNRHAYIGYLFDPYELTWYRLFFSNLVPVGFYPAGSSGGLICWVSDEAGPKSMILCNPLVNSLTPLPPTLRPRLFPSIGFHVTPSSIDIAIAGDDLISPYAVKNLTTESFHIDGGGFFSLWGTTSSLPRLCSLESGRMIFVQGKFYCMNYSPFSVLAYDVPSNSWSKIQAPMRRFLRSPSLVESRGRLVLVAAVEKSKLNVPKSLRLWGLQSCGMNWVEIERMPQQLYVEFAESEGGNGFECVGHGEFIVIMIKGGGGPGRGRNLNHHDNNNNNYSNGYYHKALLLDVWKKRWQWIPPCPYLFGGGGNGGSDGDGELHGFGYEPRLATPVTAMLHQFTTLPFQHFNMHA